jgi:hypothetical protein
VYIEQVHLHYISVTLLPLINILEKRIINEIKDLKTTHANFRIEKYNN